MYRLLGQNRLGFVRVNVFLSAAIRWTHFKLDHSNLFSRPVSLLNKTHLYPNSFNNAELQLNTLAPAPNDCSMDFVLDGIVRGLGYATLTIYTT